MSTEVKPSIMGRVKAAYHTLRGDAAFTSQTSARGSMLYDPFTRMRVEKHKNIDVQTALILYQNFWLARNLVDLPAEDVTRGGFEVAIKGKSKLADQINIKIHDLGLDTVAHDAWRYEFLYGDAAIAIGGLDGSEDLSKQVNKKNISNISFVHAVGRPAISDLELVTDLYDKNYGEIKSIKLKREGQADLEVHPDRACHLQTRGFENDKFGISIYTPMMQILQAMDSAEWSVGQLVYSMVFKVLKSPTKFATEEQRRQVMKTLEADLNALSLVTLGTEDEFDFKSPSGSLGGMQALFDYLWDSVTGGARVPKAHLLGQRSGTLAGAEWDSRSYYARIDGLRQTFYKPIIEKIVRYLLMAKELGGMTEEAISVLDWDIDFGSLFAESENELLDRRLKESQEYSAYLDRQVISPLEVRERLDWIDDPENVPVSALAQPGDANQMPTDPAVEPAPSKIKVDPKTGKKIKAGDEFVEEEHPRDASGKFSSTGEAKVFKDSVSADSWGKEHFGAWVNGLSPAETETLRLYKFSEYKPLNDLLRGKNRGDYSKSDVKLYQERIDKIDSALEKSSVPEDVTVFRGFKSEELANAIDGGTATDKVYRDKGFVSTTLSAAIADDFIETRRQWAPAGAKDVTVRAEIQVPKGSHGAFLDFDTTGLVRSESEILLPRGSKFQITGTRKDGSIRVVEMKLLNDSARADSPDSDEVLLLDSGEKFIWSDGDFVVLEGDEFNPDETRDASGKWTSGGAGSDKPQPIKKNPPKNKWVDPPQPKGTPGGKKGGFTATGEANTRFGDKAEAIVNSMGFQSLLHKNATGDTVRQNPLDTKWANSNHAFEIKAFSTEAQLYKIRINNVERKIKYAKENKFKPGVICVIMDDDKKEASVYWREGLGNFRLNEEWNFIGKKGY